MTEILVRQTLLMVSVVYGQGRIQGVGLGVYTPHQPFLKMFLINRLQFLIIFNLFDNNAFYGLSTHNRKCANKMYLLVKHSESKSKI